MLVIIQPDIFVFLPVYQFPALSLLHQQRATPHNNQIQQTGHWIYSSLQINCTGVTGKEKNTCEKQCSHFPSVSIYN